MHHSLNKVVRASRTLFSCCLIAAPLTIGPAFSTDTVCTPEYNVTYLSWEELRTPVASEAPKAIGRFSNMVVYKDYLLVVEEGKGLHIIDNSMPSAPENISFIPVHGAKQFVVAGDFIYVRSYVDLVVIDVSDPLNAFESTRVEDIFPYDDLPGSSSLDDTLGLAHREQGVVVSFITVAYRCPESPTDTGSIGCSGGSSTDVPDPVMDQNPETVGTSGSLASMILVDSYIYIIVGGRVLTLDITTPSTPSLVNTLFVDWDLETLYYHDDALYIGTSNAVDILDISERTAPKLAGSFSHAWQCDPVVVSGNVAYSTLRSGFSCDGFLNQLDILDVSDITSPTLITSVEMQEPWGLAIEDNYLFVADGSAGIKVLDVSTAGSPAEVNQIPNYNARDVIVKQGWGVMLATDALVQFDYQDINDIQIISEFSE